MAIYSLEVLLSLFRPVCCSMSSSNCCFLTCIQVSQEAGQVVWYDHLFQNFPQFIVIHTVKGFGIVNKAEIHVFLELSCFPDDPADVGNLISGSSAFSKTSLNIWKFMVHVMLKPGLENFKHYFTSVWDECNCAVVWAFFGIAFLRDWNENWPFPVLWSLLSFPNFLAYWVQHFHRIIKMDPKCNPRMYPYLREWQKISQMKEEKAMWLQQQGLDGMMTVKGCWQPPEGRRDEEWIIP